MPSQRVGQAHFFKLSCCLSQECPGKEEEITTQERREEAFLSEQDDRTVFLLSSFHLHWQEAPTALDSCHSEATTDLHKLPSSKPGGSDLSSWILSPRLSDENEPHSDKHSALRSSGRITTMRKNVIILSVQLALSLLCILALDSDLLKNSKVPLYLRDSLSSEGTRLFSKHRRCSSYTTSVAMKCMCVLCTTQCPYENLRACAHTAAVVWFFLSPVYLHKSFCFSIFCTHTQHSSHTFLSLPSSFHVSVVSEHCNETCLCLFKTSLAILRTSDWRFYWSLQCKLVLQTGANNVLLLWRRDPKSFTAPYM